MNTENIISARNIIKSYRNFTLNIPQIDIPKGFTTVIVGKNGGGKTTLLNILAALYMDYSGDITYFGDKKMPADSFEIKSRIGYQPSKCCFPLHWTMKGTMKSLSAAFDGFDREKFTACCREFGLFGLDKNKKPSGRIQSFSDGMKMKTMLAAVLSRETDLLILDEPASPLDPVMREKLCGMISGYIEKGDGEKSVIFSTHNIADTEAIADYAVMIDGGSVLEQGWTTELQEKYLIVNGELSDYEKVSAKAVYSEKNSMGFTALLLAENAECLSDADIAEVPVTLSNLSVMLMKSAESKERGAWNDKAV